MFRNKENIDAPRGVGVSGVMCFFRVHFNLTAFIASKSLISASSILEADHVTKKTSGTST